MRHGKSFKTAPTQPESLEQTTSDLTKGADPNDAKISGMLPNFQFADGHGVIAQIIAR